MEPKYMMATKAIHQLGDISSNTPDLCMITNEDESDYIGNWVAGLGFIGVRFPKETTRELTQEEKNHWNGSMLELAGNIYPLHIPGNTNDLDISPFEFSITTKSGAKYYFTAIINDKEWRAYKRNDEPWKQCLITSLVMGKNAVLKRKKFGHVRITTAITAIDYSFQLEYPCGDDLFKWEELE